MDPNGSARCPLRQGGSEKKSNWPDIVPMCVFVCCGFPGDECRLCQRDQSDEHDSHGGTGIHALHPYRGEFAP